MAVSPDEPRPQLTADEAIRHIMMDLKVTEVNPPGQFDNPALPVVHFAGKSRSIEASWDPNANSRIKGTQRSHYDQTHAKPHRLRLPHTRGRGPLADHLSVLRVRNTSHLHLRLPPTN
jgi:hypothetical protein